MQVASPEAAMPTRTPDTPLASPYADYKIIRRNGAVVAFEPAKIAVALTKAFIAVNGGQAAASARVREQVDALTAMVVNALIRRQPHGGTFHIEDIQDQVELSLMRLGEHSVARSYVLYREERAKERAARAAEMEKTHAMYCVDNGVRRPLDVECLTGLVVAACEGLADVSPDPIVQAAIRDLYDGVTVEEVRRALILAARALIEQEPGYGFVTARLLLADIRREVLGEEVAHADMATRYAEYFPRFVKRGIEAELLDERLAQFDIAKLGAALDAARDLQFNYLGLQTLYDRYFLHIEDRRIELPQAFFMRVAMGLAINEIDREARAVEFYNVLSNFDFMSSTPTLFNAGTRHSQLSSCYLTTVSDDLDGIYQAIKENAMLQKFAGGLGNDWTPVRALGSRIKGTNGKSQGVIPFLKVVNDTAVAVNQCFAPETPVFTADGIKAIRDIREGDLVLGQRGEYREVLKHMPYNQTDPMVELDVMHAIEPIRVTAGHPLWAVRGPFGETDTGGIAGQLERGEVQAEWVEAGRIRGGDFVGQVIPKEVVPVPGFDEEDARLYGILLGDGQVDRDGREWLVSGKQQRYAHINFVRAYLWRRGIQFHEHADSEGVQISWACTVRMAREGSTGRPAEGGGATLPFIHQDLYDSRDQKRIAPRFAHLPPRQTFALIRGLLETGGAASRGNDVRFTNASRPLAEGLRYQLLRLGRPCAGRAGEDTVELDVSAIRNGSFAGGQPDPGADWFIRRGWLFTRVNDVKAITPVPFVYDLKVDGDESYMTAAALAHNGGKRKGAVCAYLETWHMDIEEFLELRKNTGDDRRRTHDMNTANWIPDLFMKRVVENGEWTLFSPSDCPDLHDKYGAAFEEAYTRYEEKARARGN